MQQSSQIMAIVMNRQMAMSSTYHRESEVGSGVAHRKLPVIQDPDLRPAESVEYDSDRSTRFVDEEQMIPSFMMHWPHIHRSISECNQYKILCAERCTYLKHRLRFQDLHSACLRQFPRCSQFCIQMAKLGVNYLDSP